MFSITLVWQSILLALWIATLLTLPNRITELKHNRLKGSKLDQLIRLFLEILLQFLIIFLILCSSIIFIYIFFFLMLNHYRFFCWYVHYFVCLNAILCCLFHICEFAQYLPLLPRHRCSGIPDLQINLISCSQRLKMMDWSRDRMLHRDTVPSVDAARCKDCILWVV